MPLDIASTSTLATEAMGNLRAYFAERNHHPSADHWLAIGDVVNTLDSMARGTCEPQVYLSALDPGVGKSSAVVAFAAALAGSLEYADVGMIVCVGRVVEAESIARSVLEWQPSARIAVLTAKDDANDLSTSDVSDAQLLITTQQRLEAAAERGGFEGWSEAHYRGAPRAVRAWDEAWLPGVAITANRFEMHQIIGAVAAHSRECADALIDFVGRWPTFNDGDAVAVPDFQDAHRISFQALRYDPNLRDDERRTLASLAALSGRTARVRSDGKHGMKVLTYKDTLPTDLTPLIVLDASGRVRKTYKLIESHRGGLKPLRRAEKNYTPLTIKLWERSGSKGGWRNGGGEMINTIVETIREKPNEEWLIVAHKPEKDIPDVHKRISKRLPSVKIRTLTWGQHLASNDYSDVPNVILAGTLFMTPSYYTALTHLSQDRSVEHGFAPTESPFRIGLSTGQSS